MTLRVAILLNLRECVKKLLVEPGLLLRAPFDSPDHSAVDHFSPFDLRKSEASEAWKSLTDGYEVGNSGQGLSCRQGSG